MVKIALAQINPTIGALSANVKKILSFIEEATRAGCQIVVFPELTLTGYPPQDLLLDADFLANVDHTLLKIAQKKTSATVLVGTPRRNVSGIGKPLYNSVAVIEKGAIAGYYDKRLLPDYDHYHERRYFEPGRQRGRFRLQGLMVGITVCEDIWQNAGVIKEVNYPSDPVAELAKEPLNLVVNLSASPFSKHKPPLREMVAVKAAAIANAPLLLCNQVGANDGLIYDGHSLAITAQGELSAKAKGFEEDLLCVDFPPHASTKKRVYDAIKDLYDALVLGIHDYFHKQGFQKAHLGLSGGIDSAVTLCLAVAALGNKNVSAYFLPSRHTRPESRRDAIALAQNLKVPLKEFSIDSLYEDERRFFKKQGITPLAPLTCENIQARLRGHLLMTLSNQNQSLLLNTSNKSELAMGYATLYGDLCGSLSVLGDVLKTDVYKLAHHINRKRKVIPDYILKRPPSAELADHQKDSDTLPEYDLLDPVVQRFVEKGEGVEEICSQTGLSPALVEQIAHSILRAEYKRRQGPLALRVSEKCFSSGRYVPIVQNWK